jgi:hypothetical protein
MSNEQTLPAPLQALRVDSYTRGIGHLVRQKYGL